MYQKDDSKTVMTFENLKWKTSVEVPYPDISIEDACQMFFTVMVGATFAPETIYKGMKEFAEGYIIEREENDLQ